MERQVGESDVGDCEGAGEAQAWAEAAGGLAVVTVFTVAIDSAVEHNGGPRPHLRRPSTGHSPLTVSNTILQLSLAEVIYDYFKMISISFSNGRLN